jgi:hypothetical protein
LGFDRAAAGQDGVVHREHSLGYQPVIGKHQPASPLGHQTGHQPLTGKLTS